MSRKQNVVCIFIKENLNNRARLDDRRTAHELISFRCLYLDAHTSPNRVIAISYKSCVPQGLRAREQSVWAKEQSLLLQQRVRAIESLLLSLNFCCV